MKKKKLIKLIILIVAIVLLVVLEILIYNQVQINRFKEILEENDSTNYELIQTDGITTATIKVYGNIYTYEDENNYIWISESENLRVVMDKKNKSAIITENPENELKVGSLNSTYLDYFENDSMKFKYLGEENPFYKLQFINKGTGNNTIFYLNSENGVVEKIEENFNGAQNIYDITVNLESVTSEEVVYPDLSEYDIGVSSSTVPEESEESYENEVTDENIINENISNELN